MGARKKSTGAAARKPVSARRSGGPRAWRRETEEQLRAALLERKAIDDTVPVGILHTRNRVILKSNRRFEEIFGYEPGELVGRQTRMLYASEEEWQRLGPGIYAAIGRGEIARYEVETKRKDGERFWVEVHGRAVDPAHPFEGGIFAIQDISDRRRQERELRRVQFAVENAADAMYRVSSTGRILAVNAAACRQLGYTREDLLCLRIQDLDPEFDDQVWGRHWEELRAKGALRFESRNRRKNGEVFPVEVSTAFIATDEGEERVSYVLDITQRKAAERQSRESEERYRELSGEQRQRVRELELANREMESFTYSISHDLRAPLRAIDGFSRLLGEEYAGELGPEARRLLARIGVNAQRMGQLIDDLLGLSRTLLFDMSPAEVDLSGMARETAAALRDLDPGRKAEFVIGDGIAAVADPALIQIVLDNLLSNAWKFSSRHPSARIEFGARPQGGDPVYFVRDDGAGFDMAYANKLFVAFQRLHQTDEFPGNGIGLATVQRIIQRHGGRIWAESAVERGATFYFTLGSDAAQ